jgi:hypothetical protein
MSRLGGYAGVLIAVSLSGLAGPVLKVRSAFSIAAAVRRAIVPARRQDV